MRFKMLILSSLLFIAFLAVTAFCVDWDNPSGNADEMISSGEVAKYKNPSGFAATPQLQREIDKNKSSLDWTMPSTLTGGGNTAKESRTQAESASEEAVDSTAAEEVAPVADTSAVTDTELPRSAGSSLCEWKLVFYPERQRREGSGPGSIPEWK